VLLIDLEKYLSTRHVVKMTVTRDSGGFACILRTAGGLVCCSSRMNSVDAAVAGALSSLDFATEKRASP
jgi:hypothetical protein